ncbi:hypothetical protein E8E13_007057 [Curvularia kusanoi]|uniref:Coenzyme Q-binding protein COQ10 START domain-containing protein n=1 Tax=Curvularia kusanoi TaxID=90978 RepID=A0A9P4TIU7_CURKU|nr:hypothetical protein E8E13_007057 [Curvularia kusanoi]
MASLTPLLRPALRTTTTTTLPTLQTRTFLPNIFSSATSGPPTSSIQTLRASRTLPYPPAPIYSIIADVPSYSSFLPYCTRSSITHWSAPDAITGRRWPSIGVLTSGFGSFSESFASRVYCVPGKVVESVGGETQTTLARELIAHHFVDAEGRDIEADGGAGLSRKGSQGLLTHLRNTWTVEEVGTGKTRIELSLEFAFANPVYAALSAGVVPKVAEAMVRAFEERVEGLLRESPEMVAARLEELDGSRLRR